MSKLFRNVLYCNSLEMSSFGSGFPFGGGAAAEGKTTDAGAMGGLGGTVFATGDRLKVYRHQEVLYFFPL